MSATFGPNSAASDGPHTDVEPALDAADRQDLSGFEALPTALLEDPVFAGRHSPTHVHPAVLAGAALGSGGRLASETVALGWAGVREWAAGFVLAQRSAHTRRAYVADLRHYLGWCMQVELVPGRVARADLDRYARVLELAASERTGRPLGAASRARRLACVAGFYRYAALELGWAQSPAAHLARPRTGAETPLGPTRAELAALLTAAAADSSRAAALVSLLAHTGLRIEEALSRDIAHWRREAGHEVLDLERRGGITATTVLPAPVVRALRAHLGGRTTGPLFFTVTGGRLDQPAAWRLLRRLVQSAGLEHPERISPHALRHAFITMALGAGASLRDVQDAAGHADPATTRAYDDARARLDRHPGYAVSTLLAGTSGAAQGTTPSH